MTSFKKSENYIALASHNKNMNIKQISFWDREKDAYREITLYVFKNIAQILHSI